MYILPQYEDRIRAATRTLTANHSRAVGRGLTFKHSRAVASAGRG